LAERDIYTSLPDPVTMGKKLFAWLDGAGRWLNRALEAGQEEVLVLAIANLVKLPHLPWEVLHDLIYYLHLQINHICLVEKADKGYRFL